MYCSNKTVRLDSTGGVEQSFISVVLYGRQSKTNMAEPVDVKLAKDDFFVVEISKGKHFVHFPMVKMRLLFLPTGFDKGLIYHLTVVTRDKSW